MYFFRGSSVIILTRYCFNLIAKIRIKFYIAKSETYSTSSDTAMTAIPAMTPEMAMW